MPRHWVIWLAFGALALSGCAFEKDRREFTVTGQRVGQVTRDLPTDKEAPEVKPPHVPSGRPSPRPQMPEPK